MELSAHLFDNVQRKKNKMLKFLIRNCPVVRRWKSQFILAEKVDGKLIEVKIDIADPYALTDGLIANVKLADNNPAVCTFRPPRRIVSRDQNGQLAVIKTQKGAKWAGQIKKENCRIEFFLEDAVDELLYKSPTGKFLWDSNVIYEFDEYTSFRTKSNSASDSFASNIRKKVS